ncbi:phospho-sugar mutase [Clostridium botulinum]|uniref:Phosphoglucomutase n=2 Tax=Clostridium botulinum TaxID=1491 RepID=A0A9Q1UWE0_CLOBO|nr:phospho-sugar mutase [Clostridium botulinum]AEB75668.1 phosphoglucomutase/phosphomannomutase alpha/beta/alpha domain I [Clostridium botulinum BKT015925]KEI01292.1 phosphoglucomutase [Clostridium botulinum C/D str. Sp77]KEI02171.1 phosphoglucomutase [Clostridium botulinum D str. 16868]KLU76429.1 phosphoglucomutase [Clostridium botulinum V891]KOA78840.1 phosphoglucomutase [Clostridium botulinum]
MNYLEKYNEWLESRFIDEETKKELKNIEDEKELEDRFYKNLNFGTGGLRGVIGAGSNRMNMYTVTKATQGLAEYLLNKYKDEAISVSIAYDSRIKSQEFATSAALTLCGNGIKVNLFESLRPTPMLSYTVKHLKSKAGIVITASHNPKQYNGYKVYGDDGGQVTDKKAKEIITYVEKIQDFSKVKSMSLNDAKAKGLLNIIGEEIDNDYIESVKKLTIREGLVSKDAKKLKIIYTPIHGSGNVPVRRVLRELGYEKVFVVKEQELPDGTFPTAEYPNPEVPAVFDIALNMAKDIRPDIIFGTDPDCDRIGAIVKDNNGKYEVLTGNMMGVLLTEYILSSLKEKNKMPINPVVIKTIVTTEMIKPIAKKFNVEVIDVLTGFKYIGEKIKEFENDKNKNYVFGFEESYGYLAGTFVRDKDAVIAAMIICEMALYYKTKGMSLYDALMTLYNKYGFYRERLVSVNLEGIEGQKKINNTLDKLRNIDNLKINEVNIIKKYDYENSIVKDILTGREEKISLPKSNVLKFVLEDNSYFVVRPSGTEPKMKIYMAIIGKSLEDAENKMDKFKENVMNLVDETMKNR